MSYRPHEAVRHANEIDPLGNFVGFGPTAQWRKLHDALPHGGIVHHGAIELGKHTARVDAVANSLRRQAVRDVFRVRKNAALARRILGKFGTRVSARRADIDNRTNPRRGLRGGEVAHERICLGDIDGALQVNGDVVCALDASIVHDDVGLEAGGKRRAVAHVDDEMLVFCVSNRCRRDIEAVYMPSALQKQLGACAANARRSARYECLHWLDFCAAMRLMYAAPTFSRSQPRTTL